MNTKNLLKVAMLGAIATLTLNGCSLGIGEEEFACKGRPGGTQCVSSWDLYERTNNGKRVGYEHEAEEDDEYNNLYTTSNSTTSNSENLADTGIGDSSAVALIIVISAVVAIYSARKFNEYKNV